MPAPVRDARQVVLLVLDGLGWEQFVEHRAADADAGGDRGRPDHDRRADDDGDRADVDRHRADTGRARPGRLPDGCRRRGAQRAALGDGGGRRPPQARAEPTSSRSPPFLGQPVPVVTKAELRTHRVHRGPPARRSPGRLAGGVEPGDHGRRSCCAPASRSSTPTTTASTRSPTSAASARSTTPSCVRPTTSSADVAPSSPTARRCWSPPTTARSTSAQRSSRSTDDVLKLTRNLSGEGRFRWLHARPGPADDLLDAADGRARRRGLGDEPPGAHRGRLVRPGRQPADRGPARRRGPDAQDPISFVDPADTGPFPLVCRHGSLTAAEMLVPLLASTR